MSFSCCSRTLLYHPVTSSSFLTPSFLVYIVRSPSRDRLWYVNCVREWWGSSLHEHMINRQWECFAHSSEQRDIWANSAAKLSPLAFSSTLFWSYCLVQSRCTDQHLSPAAKINPPNARLPVQHQNHRKTSSHSAAYLSLGLRVELRQREFYLHIVMCNDTWLQMNPEVAHIYCVGSQVVRLTRSYHLLQLLASQLSGAWKQLFW